MDVLAPLVVALIAVPLVALWLYGVLHPLLNHGRAGLSFVILLVPAIALVYAALHRCPRPPPPPT